MYNFIQLFFTVTIIDQRYLRKGALMFNVYIVSHMVKVRHWHNDNTPFSLLLPITYIVTNDVHWNCASLKAPEREIPAGIRQEQMHQSPLQDANLVNMIQGTVETNRILAEYLRRDLHTRREEDGTRANDRRGNGPKTFRWQFRVEDLHQKK